MTNSNGENRTSRFSTLLSEFRKLFDCNSNVVEDARQSERIDNFSFYLIFIYNFHKFVAIDHHRNDNIYSLAASLRKSPANSCEFKLPIKTVEGADIPLQLHAASIQIRKWNEATRKTTKVQHIKGK